MAKFTITYHRKVKVREWEMLDIGLTEEFELDKSQRGEAYAMVSSQVDLWIEEARKRV